MSSSFWKREKGSETRETGRQALVLLLGPKTHALLAPRPWRLTVSFLLPASVLRKCPLCTSRDRVPEPSETPLCRLPLRSPG